MIFSFPKTHKKNKWKFVEVVIFMGAGFEAFRNHKIVYCTLRRKIWKQMTSSCKYIDHTSYSQALDFCNQCNEVDWSQFKIKYNLDITSLPSRNFYKCRGYFVIRKEYKRIEKNQGNETEEKREIILMKWCDGLYLEILMKVYDECFDRLENNLKEYDKSKDIYV